MLQDTIIEDIKMIDNDNSTLECCSIKIITNNSNEDIVTNTSICLGTCTIDDDQNCCEIFGIYAYILDENDANNRDRNIQKFIGSELLDITNLEINKAGVYGEKYIKVDVLTSKGTLQIMIYNEHNGYYSHWVSIRSRSLKYGAEI